MDGNAGLTVLERTVCSRPLRAEIRRMDDGIHVLLTGGDRSHIGSISWAEPGDAAHSKVFPGHRDDVLSESWAASIAHAAGVRTAVVCGVHYDNASPTVIDAVVRASEEMRMELVSRICSGTES